MSHSNDWSRRGFLGTLAGGALAGLGASLLPLGRAAAQSTQGKRFLFVFNNGGWDPLTVFAPLFDSASVEMEGGTQPMEIGRFRLVDHPGRPSVRRFFERHYERSLLLNGLSVRSVAHDTCALLALSANASGAAPDWATRIAAAERDAYTLPHLVLAGPAVSGDLSVATARVGQNGQLQALLTGAILDTSETPVQRLTPAAESIMDRYLARRLGARAEASGQEPGADRIFADMAQAHDRARDLKADRYEVRFQAGGNIQAQLDTAVQALAEGICRCATVSPPMNWDTHADNQPQSQNFEALFAGLDGLMDTLAITLGPEGRPLSEDTIVVVMSEMGRTPRYNATEGRDHWPFTSVLVVGDGVTGDRVAGGYDAGFYGIGIDPASGDSDPDAVPLSVESLGATLLALAGVDPAEAPAGGVPITGLLT